MTLARENIEANVETTLQAMTISAGYNLPKDLGLVTRKILDYDETTGHRPAAIIQFPSLRTELIGLGSVGQSTLEGRVILYFDLDTGSLLPATWANRYVESTRAALLADRSRGANPYVLTTRITAEPTALLWKVGQALEATLDFEVVFLHEGNV